jgi:hypothetical protein
MAPRGKRSAIAFKAICSNRLSMLAPFAPRRAQPREGPLL